VYEGLKLLVYGTPESDVDSAATGCTGSIWVITVFYLFIFKLFFFSFSDVGENKDVP